MSREKTEAISQTPKSPIKPNNQFPPSTKMTIASHVPKETSPTSYNELKPAQNNHTFESNRVFPIEKLQNIIANNETNIIVAVRRANKRSTFTKATKKKNTLQWRGRRRLTNKTIKKLPIKNARRRQTVWGDRITPAIHFTDQTKFSTATQKEHVEVDMFINRSTTQTLTKCRKIVFLERNR